MTQQYLRQRFRTTLQFFGGAGYVVLRVEHGIIFLLSDHTTHTTVFWIVSEKGLNYVDINRKYHGIFVS